VVAVRARRRQSRCSASTTRASACWLLAPIVLALIGFGRLRDLAVFIGFFLAGAALTGRSSAPVSPGV